MVIRYDTNLNTFVIEADNCEDCGGDLYDTGCEAPTCNGRMCPDCGKGCDWEFPEGLCRQAADAESDEDYTTRVNAERTACGLRPIQDSRLPEEAPDAH